MQKSKVKINRGLPAKKLRSKFSAGFTLIELMVSISIFSVVMLIVIGALLMLNDANKKAQAMRSIVDNLNFAMEDMTRNIRTGKDFRCGLGISGGRASGSPVPCNLDSHTKPGIDTIGFTGIQEVMTDTGVLNKVCYVYSFVGKTETAPGTIKYGTKNIEGTQECSDIFNQISMTTLVSPEIDISGLKFYIFDENSVASETTYQQPIVIIALSGDINVEKYKFKTPFNIQTTVSQRGTAL